jgi:hypothetical protein
MRVGHALAVVAGSFPTNPQASEINEVTIARDRRDTVVQANLFMKF